MILPSLSSLCKFGKPHKPPAMMLPNTMSTVSEVLNHLKENGYSVDFNLDDNCLICHGNSLKIHPEEFVVDKVYRFEGITDPGDEAVVYAISSLKHNIKGVLVNGYGIYAEAMADEMIKALSPTENPEDFTSIKIEEKFNISTPQRPQGERMLDASMVFMDLGSFIKQIKEEQQWQESDRNSITIFKTDVMRLVLIALHPNAEMITHTAPGAISVHVLEGEIRFTTPEGPTVLTQGQILGLHAGIPHSVLAQTEAVFLLTLTLPAKPK